MDRTYKYKSRIVANWDRIPKVEGRVIELGSQKIDNRVSHFMKVETEDGEVTVFKSAGLEDLFNAATTGDFVSIEYLATVETQKGRPFRQFKSSCWTDESAPAVAARKRRGRKPKDEPRTPRR